MLIKQKLNDFKLFVKNHNQEDNYIELGRISNSYTLDYFLFNMTKNELFNGFYCSSSQFPLKLNMDRCKLIKTIKRELHCRKNYLQNCLLFGGDL